MERRAGWVCPSPPKGAHAHQFRGGRWARRGRDEDPQRCPGHKLTPKGPTRLPAVG